MEKIRFNTLERSASYFFCILESTNGFFMQRLQFINNLYGTEHARRSGVF